MFCTTLTLGFSQGGDKDIFGNEIKKLEYSVKNCFTKARYKEGFNKDSLKINKIMHGQKIWRTVSLDNKTNQDVLNSSKCSNVGLFEVIKYGIFEKKLNVFSSDNFDETSKSRLDKKQVQKLITVSDTVVETEFDAQGNENTKKVFRSAVMLGTDIKSYLVKEDWFVNSYSGKLEKRIVGIAPLVFDKKNDKTQPLFWIYFDEWKNLFDCFEAKNYMTDEIVSFKDVIQKNYFIFKVSKESNIFDRTVKSTQHSTDAQLESEVIKQKMSNREGDLFQH